MSWNRAADFYADIPATSLRIICTTIFVLLNYTIMFLGERLIQRHAQRRFVENKSVPITQMTPWFNLFGTLKYLKRYRCLPGGIIGVLMILSGAFAFADSYIVNSFVVAPFEQTNCGFNYGLVAYWGEDANPTKASPVAFWPVSSLATRALYDANPDAQGVYTKIDTEFNKNDKMFSPLQNDIIGKWSCTTKSILPFELKDLVNQDTVESVIWRQGFQYNKSSASIGTQDSGIIDSIMMWSADQFNNDTNPDWTIHATFGNKLKTSLHATNYQCEYKEIKTWKRPIIPVNDALNKWKDIMSGNIVDSDVTLHHYYLEVMLNSMTMVAASSNQLWSRSDLDPNNQDTTYGCKKTKNTIKQPVWIIAFILCSLIVILGVVDLWNYYGKWSSGRKDIAKEIPFDFQEWQVMALKHMTGNLGLQPKGVKYFEYFYDGSTAKHKVDKMGKTGTPQYNALSDLEMFSSDGFRRPKKSAVVSYTNL